MKLPSLLLRIKVLWLISAYIFIIFTLYFIRAFYFPQQGCKNCNLILISVDTLRADHMGIYGYKSTTTPNIDEWAKGAYVFTNMKTLIPTTYPSLSIFMTGITPFVSKIFDNSTGYGHQPAAGLVKIDKNAKTLPQILKENGYTTGAFVNNESLNGELTDLNKGFDQYKVFQDTPLNGPRKENKSFTTVTSALEWLEKNKDKKFFIWIHLMEPHAPYLPTKEFYCKFGNSCEQIRDVNDLWQLEEERKSLMGCHPEGMEDEKLKLFEALYDGSIASADQLISKIFDKVDAADLDNNSVVMLYGDHGEGFDHNYFFFHNHNLYDSFVKIPFIVKLPSQTINIKRNELLDNTQIMPTLLDLLSVKYNSKQLSGISFAPLLQKNEKIPQEISPEYVFFVNNGLSKYGIQNNRYKYIYSTDRACLMDGQTEELYDLIDDPQETKNLNEENIEIRNTLKKTLFEYLAKYNLPSDLAHATKDKVQKQSVDKKVLEKLKSLGY